MFRRTHWESKTSVPKVFNELLPRRNIAAIINDASLNEAVCMVAPYGCGKTLAVVSWLREQGGNAAWLSLDEADASEVGFFAGLSAAVMRLSGWQGKKNDILTDPRFMENLQAFLWEHISAAEKNDGDKILVIDDLQFIQDQVLLRKVKNLVSALLTHWRVVIICRTELPSVFNDLMLKRQICLITLEELSFSKEEIAEYFKISGLAASPEDIDRISEETEGWPVSLNVILTISKGGTVRYGEAAREYVMGFFETEIWKGLSENIRDFLLKTSVLDKLTPAACNAVTGNGATLPTLRWLFVNGLFIFRLEKDETYRYHRVFRDFLQGKLTLSGIVKRELYKKIGWWMFERDEFEQSFPYFFKAGDMYGLSRVFRIINSADMGLEKYLKLTGCITSLNVEDLRAYPLIVAKMALIHFVQGNISEMQRLYDIFIDWIEPGVLSLSPEEYAECMWEAGWLSYLNPAEPILGNKHEEWFNYAEYDPRLKALHHSRAAVYRFPSMLRGIRDYCPVLDILEEYVQQNKETNYGTIDDEVSIWRLDIVRAEYAYELENFAVAEKLIKNVITEVEGQQITDLYFVCIALLVKIVRAVHNPKEIGALASRLEAMIIKSGHDFLLPRFHAFELRNRLADGIAGQTEVFERENRDYAEKPYFHLFYRHMTLVRALLSTSDYNEATMILGNMARLCHQYSRIMDLIEVNILRSIADYGLGHEEDACRYLTEAINGARKYGFIRIFSDDAKDIWPILTLINKETNDDYIKSIVISCKKTLTRAGIKTRTKDKAHEKLTKTELKMLKTLNTDMSYEEIAMDHGIKVSTVKSHLQAIYSKLGVNNRTSAVMAARQMGLIH